MVRSPRFAAQRYFDRPASDDSDFPLKFEPSDPTYRIWCNLHVLPAFLALSLCQLAIAVAILCISVMHLSNTDWQVDRNSSGSPDAVQKSTKLHFEPFDFLVFLRIGLVALQILGIFSGFLAAWRQRASDLLVTLWGDTLLVIGCFGYFVLLAYHSIVREDYYGFCFVGLSLLLVLVVNVLGAQVTWQLLGYYKDLGHFLQVAKRRWPDVSHCAAQSENGVYRKPGLLCDRIVPGRYRVSRALIRRAAGEQNRFYICDAGSSEVSIWRTVKVGEDNFCASGCSEPPEHSARCTVISLPEPRGTNM